MELIAAASIVLSLVFVGYELRQASTVARLEAIHAYSMSVSEHTRELSHNPELALLVLNSIQNIRMDELTAKESAQLVLHHHALLNIYHGLYSSVREGIIPEEYLTVLSGDGSLKSEYFRGLWPTIETLYSDDFAVFIESQFAQ